MSGRAQEKRRYVYFAQTVEPTDGRVKIGCSYQPASRLIALAVWSAYPIKIVAVAPGDFSTERRLHEFFAADRLHNEWFRCSPALLTVMKLLSERVPVEEALAAVSMRQAA